MSDGEADYNRFKLQHLQARQEDDNVSVHFSNNQSHSLSNRSDREGNFHSFRTASVQGNGK